MTKQLNGFRAASIIIEELLYKAEKENPLRRNKNFRKTSLYRAGYYDGLLITYCQLALGEFPDNNCEIIDKTIFKKQ